MNASSPPISSGLGALYEQTPTGLKYRPQWTPESTANVESPNINSFGYALGQGLRDAVTNFQPPVFSRAGELGNRAFGAGAGALLGTGLAGLANWALGPVADPTLMGVGGGLLGTALGGFFKKGAMNNPFPDIEQLRSIILSATDIPQDMRSQMLGALYTMSDAERRAAIRVAASAFGAGVGSALVQYFAGRGLVTGGLGALGGALLGYFAGPSMAPRPTSNTFNAFGRQIFQ